jgi:molybdopterin molybdotransferase
MSGQKLANDCFALPPGVEWTPVEEALSLLEARLTPVAAVETCALAQAAGRYLASPVIAARANPAHPNAAVDGYAFAHASLAAEAAAADLTLLPGRAAAGVPFPGTLGPGEAVRILTGAPMPQGADTVVLQEDVAVEGDRLRFAAGLKAGANWRAAGEDVQAGATALAPGRRLMPQDLALAAAVGIAALEVHRPLKVAILSTGDEVRAPGSDAAPHQLFDANRPMLAALMAAWGHEVIDLGIIADDAAAVEAALERAVASADAVLTTGGASTGDEDHTAAVLARRGQLTSWRIAMKPGRPLALATWDGVPIFGLPGNPVAAFVCALIFARPALSVLAGGGWRAPQAMQLPAAFSKRKKAGRREYLRARLTGAGAVEVFHSEGSGRISGLTWADGLVELPDAAGEVAPGDLVRYLPFAGFAV